MINLPTREDNPTPEPNENDPIDVTPDELRAGIILKFTKFDQGHSQYGPFWLFIGVDEDGRTRSLPLWHTTARRRTRNIKPQGGERIFFKEKGKRTSGVGRSYTDYTIKPLDRPPVMELPPGEDEQIDEGLLCDPPDEPFDEEG